MKRMFAGLLAYLLCSLTMTLFAMDVVTLKGGEILSGQISERDDDGGVIMTLTNGLRRYVMPDEIVSISQNESPFEVTKPSNDKLKPIGSTIYIGYEDLKYSHRYARGGVLGVSYNLGLDNGFLFAPSFEVGYNNGGRNNDFCMRLPIQAGYILTLNSNVNIKIHTGPVVSYDTTSSYKHLSADWRLGLNTNIKKVIIGLKYNLGMSDISKSEYRMIHRNYFQVVVGYSF